MREPTLEELGLILDVGQKLNLSDFLIPLEPEWNWGKQDIEQRKQTDRKDTEKQDRQNVSENHRPK
jgi:hypothetical protein